MAQRWSRLLLLCHAFLRSCVATLRQDVFRLSRHVLLPRLLLRALLPPLRLPPRPEKLLVLPPALPLPPLMRLLVQFRLLYLRRLLEALMPLLCLSLPLLSLLGLLLPSR